jgi:hypothetical protein
MTKFSRRTLLGGAGVALALPFMESLLPKRAVAQAAAPKRLLAFYVPNGIRMSSWTPAAQGADYALTSILKPLEGVRAHLSVLSGLANRPARPDGPGDHAAGTGSFITCAHVQKTEGTDIRNGVSMDQAYAQAIANQTRFPSLQLGIDGGGTSGGCDSGYSCAYSRNISWSGPATPVAKQTNPRDVYDRLFAGFDPNASAKDLERIRLERKSVLDYVLGESQSLSAKLGATDRRKLDEYMTGVRELERRLDQTTENACEMPARPGTYDYPTHVKLMCDLMVLALQCDSTRAVTFMLGNAGSNRVYDFLGISGGHHEISHHGSDAAKLASLEKIAIWEMTQFAYLLQKMEAVNEGERTLLGNSAVFLSSDIEDGNTHSHFNMPILLAGAAGGAFKPGRHIVFGSPKDQAKQPSVGKLFVSILNAMGVSATKFGDDGDGPLAGL